MITELGIEFVSEDKWIVFMPYKACPRQREPENSEISQKSRMDILKQTQTG